MPRSTPTALVLSAVAAMALSSGCTTSVSGAASADSAAAAQGTVAWVDKICGSLLPYIKTAVAAPKPRDARDAATFVRDFTAWLGESEKSAGSAVDGMAAAGSAPIAGGDEVIDRLSGTLKTMQASYRDARTRLEQVDVNDRQELQRVVPAAVESVQRLARSPMADLQRVPELAQAGREAAGCQQIAREFGR